MAWLFLFICESIRLNRYNEERWRFVRQAVYGPSRTFQVIGLGHFGGQLALIRFLASLGHRVEIWELKREDQLRASWHSLSDIHEQLQIHWGSEPRCPSSELFFISPALPPSAACLREVEDRFICTEIELSLGLALERGVDLHVVTGSVGKSTTGALLANALDLPFVGNIGRSLLSLAEPWPRAVVVELSSFQLHYLKALVFLPFSSIITPIRDHHAQWHGGVEAYQRCKLDAAELWANGGVQTAQNSAPVDPDLREVSECRELWGDREFLLLGEHNLKNLWTVIRHLRSLEACSDSAMDRCSRFGGLPHRLEFCGRVAQTKFINDSKATSPSAVMEALQSLDEGAAVILQGEPTADMGALMSLVAKKCSLCFLVSGMRSLLEQGCVPSSLKTLSCEDLNEVFEHDVLSFHTVLLSPSAPSYGQYANYEERGEHFKALVASLKADI